MKNLVRHLLSNRDAPIRELYRDGPSVHGFEQSESQRPVHFHPSPNNHFRQLLKRIALFRIPLVFSVVFCVHLRHLSNLRPPLE
jgi:hypothetical protein